MSLSLEVILFRQLNKMDCGSTCLRVIVKYYGKRFICESKRAVTGFSSPQRVP